MAKSDEPPQADKASVKLVLDTHVETFETSIYSATTDKGYYAAKNEKLIHGIEEISMESPSNVTRSRPIELSKYREKVLIDRHAGTEPIIWSLKKSGSGRA